MAAKETGLECTCVNNDDFTVLVSGVVDAIEWHVYCVAVTFKVIEQVEQWICIKFCVKLEHSSTETIWVIQKSTAMGKWYLAASSQQRAHSCITSPAEFFCETSNHPSDSAPLQPRFGVLQCMAFPKTKITFEREKISDYWWDSGKYPRAADSDSENCVRFPSAYFEGGWGVHHCPMYNVSCILYLLQ